jgi:hypothetical protein
MNLQTISHSVAVLELFSHILLEYHLEYKTSKKNWKSGFQVSVTRPIIEPSTSVQGRTMAYRRYLYAIKNGTYGLLEIKLYCG